MLIAEQVWSLKTHWSLSGYLGHCLWKPPSFHKHKNRKLDSCHWCIPFFIQHPYIRLFMWQSQEAESRTVSSVQDNALPYPEQKVTSDLTFLMFWLQYPPPTSHSRCESEQLIAKECWGDSALHMSWRHKNLWPTVTATLINNCVDKCFIIVITCIIIILLYKY